MTDKTAQLEALESTQAIINGLPEGEAQSVLAYAEDIRDLLSEGGEQAFLALTLVACEFGAVHAEREKMEAQDEQPSAE